MSPLPRLTVPGGGELPPIPHGQARPVSRTEGSIADLPLWADELATIIAYAVVFWGISAGLHAVNIKGGFIVAAALLGITWMLRSFLVEPVARLIRQIILLGFQILLELIDFVRQWYEGVLHYFQGNLVRAITRVLLVAAFLWVWEFAQTIPAVRNILDTIAEVVARVVRYVNETIDSVLRFVRDLRDDVNGRLTLMLDRIGLANSALRDELVSQVNGLFGILTRQVGRLRTQLVARLDVVHTLAHARITLLGQTIALLPKAVNDRMVAAFAKVGTPLAGDALSLAHRIAARYSPPGAVHATPWEVVDEFQAHIAARAQGFVPLPVEWVGDVREAIRGVQAGTPPTEIAEWPLILQSPADEAPAPIGFPGQEYTPDFYLPMLTGE